jgi:hypothetical protein
MSNVKKIGLFAAIILSTFSVLTAANASVTREQAISQGGSGVAAYGHDGGIVTGHWN